ncbi:hypothetical protein EVAR_95207_1 [Eumeta japonica]|uniref:Uncharacterized protein n=1 Tax=Eumeta variegata TaxID=151549 RepID=A0A4C1VHK6_EUMVA|nr:hypothetical protein EVAR_95207_1 [Eumeta japonica]
MFMVNGSRNWAEIGIGIEITNACEYEREREREHIHTRCIRPGVKKSHTTYLQRVKLGIHVTFLPDIHIGVDTKMTVGNSRVTVRVASAGTAGLDSRNSSVAGATRKVKLYAPTCAFATEIAVSIMACRFNDVFLISSVSAHTTDCMSSCRIRYGVVANNAAF